MKILQKLGKYLYFKYGEVDVAEMTRLQLIGHIQRTQLEDMSDAEKMKIKEGCVDLIDDPTLKYVIDEYINDVKEHILYEANTEQQVLLGRFSLNGASAIFERIREYALWMPEKEEEFDKYSVI